MNLDVIAKLYPNVTHTIGDEAFDIDGISILLDFALIDAHARSIAHIAPRATRFSVEADPLFFQEQAGEVPAGTWLAKRQQIKAEIPKIA